MISADAANTAAIVTLFLMFVRLVQTHIKPDSTLGSALAFVFH
jgi:hypothetical protein